jgi:hypothetical protein
VKTWLRITNALYPQQLPTNYNEKNIVSEILNGNFVDGRQVHNSSILNKKITFVRMDNFSSI